MPKRLLILLALLAVLAVVGVVRQRSLPHFGPGHGAYRTGLEAAERGDVEAAVRALRQAVLTEPENGDYHADLGELYLRRSRYDEAAAELQSAAFLTPDRPHVYCQLAQALVEVRRRSEALEALELALKKTPDCPHALAVRGEQFLRDDNLKDALPAFQQLMEKQPDFVLAYQKAGFLLLATNRLDEAVQVLEKGIKLAPAHPGMHALLAEAYARRPRDPQAEQLAIQHYQASLLNNPEAARAYAALGKLYVRKNELEAARTAFEKALELQPSLSEARYGLSQVATRQGQTSEAARQLALFQEGQALERKVSELQAQALAHPTDVDLQIRIARLALQHRFSTVASRALEAAMLADPGRREVRELRAELFRGLGNGNRATEELAVASRLPASPLQ